MYIGKSISRIIRLVIYLVLLISPLLLNSNARAEWPAEGLAVCAEGSTVPPKYSARVGIIAVTLERD
jgi:hypothetical protein